MNVTHGFIKQYNVYINEIISIHLSRGGARGVPGGPLPPQNFAWPHSGHPKIRSLSVGLFLKVLHRPLTAPLVAKLAPPVATPNENVWLRPCILEWCLVTLHGYFASVCKKQSRWSNHWSLVTSGVQRSGDVRGDCLIVCPPPKSSVEQQRMVVIVTGYTLFATS